MNTRQLFPLTRRKARELLGRGMKVRGFVMHHPISNQRVIVSDGASRSLSGSEMAALLSGATVDERGAR